MNPTWKSLSVENEIDDEKSVLTLYRTALTLRALHLSGAGEITWLESPIHGLMRNDLLVFKRGSVTVAMNLSTQAQEIQWQGTPVIVSSGELEVHAGKTLIPGLSCMWSLN
jgi:alpha-glucosidase